MTGAFDIGRRAAATGSRCACGGIVGTDAASAPPAGRSGSRRGRPDGRSDGGGAGERAAGTSSRAVGVERKDGVAHGPAGRREPVGRLPGELAAEGERGAVARRELGGQRRHRPRGISRSRSRAAVATLLIDALPHDVRQGHRDDREPLQADPDGDPLLARLRVRDELRPERPRLRLLDLDRTSHVCPYWFSSSAELQAATVVHEIAHDVVGADDNAYEWQTAKYAGMSVSAAMNNADSFGALRLGRVQAAARRRRPASAHRPHPRPATGGP